MANEAESEIARTVTVRLGAKQTEALDYVKGRLSEESGEEYTDEQALRIALVAMETVANRDKFAGVVREALGVLGTERQT